MPTKDYTANSILLVDDEASILRSLKRLFMPLKCQIYLASSADEAINILRENPVDLIITDMRMPGTSGDQFLAQAAVQWPETERIMLSGYSDAETTISAINNGAVSRFILKPWDDQELLKTVCKYFNLAQLKQRNEALEKISDQKSVQLEELNKSLELKVAQRTTALEKSNNELRDSYRSIIKMFSSLISSRLVGQNNADAHSLDPMLLKIADQFEFSEIESKQLHYAWQLRFLGKLSFSDEILQTPYLEMSAEQQRQFQRHPLLSHAACLSVKPLYLSGLLLLQHKEYLDGSGYPRGLTAKNIDMRAQIISVLSDYRALITGMYSQRCFSSEQAFEYLSETAAERYNQKIVLLLRELVAQTAAPLEVQHARLQSSSELVSGMKLSRDIVTATGCLLLSAGLELDDTFISRVCEMEKNLEEQLNIYINV